MLRLAQARNKPAYKRYEKRCAQHKPYRQQRRRDYHFHFLAPSYLSCSLMVQKILLIIANAVR